MLLDRLRYEARILGKWAFLTPFLVMSVLSAFLVLLKFMLRWVVALRFSEMATAGLEMLLPLAMGIVIATLISTDPAMELQLTLKKSFRMTALSRLVLLLTWAALVELVSWCLAFALNFWRVPLQLHGWSGLGLALSGQLTWLSPLLFLAGLGLCLSLLIRSRAASVALLGGLWLLELLAYGLFVTYTWLHPLFLFPTTQRPDIQFWFSNRFELLGLALLLFILGGWLLRNSEMLLQTTKSGE
jgi:hypothetical protein